MKKIIILAVALAFAGCGKVSNRDIDDDIVSHMSKIEWGGHSYVIFSFRSNAYDLGYYVNSVSITHDPDCHCIKVNNGGIK